ncbi:MAG: KpsF/GutQ family sugar-phosphate isomerase [Alphaproteobacteria bacterium]|nr:KpsF/GutQ family sugar-phosphate isomerase [Alphaproteobacteria bacterium]
MTDEELIASGRRTMTTEMSAVQVLHDELNGDFVKAVRMILGVKGRVIVSGMGKSGHIGQKIAATLASVGTPAFFVHPGEASHGDLGMITRDDLVIAISNSGESREMGDIVSYTRRFGIPMIAMTGNPASTMGKAADLVLAIPDKKRIPEACPFGLAPTTSTTATLVLGDALSIALLEARGFSRDEYRDRHPGGKLGAVLLKIEDIMLKGDAVPVIGPDVLMADALVVMTAKSQGCLGVVDAAGKIIGVITDGDLRRHMAADLIVRRTSDVMTQNPKTMKPGLLGSEALRLMSESKITNTFVVDAAGRPVGFLHLHHLLQAGVA